MRGAVQEKGGGFTVNTYPVDTGKGKGNRKKKGGKEKGVGAMSRGDVD